MRITSPGATEMFCSLSISTTYEPNWPTIMRPLASVIIGNSSCCSRITGDIAERNSTASISWRALRRAFSIMSNEIVSSFCDGARPDAGAGSASPYLGTVCGLGVPRASAVCPLPPLPNCAAHFVSASSVARWRARPSSPLARAEPNCIFETPSTVSLHNTVTTPLPTLCSTTSEDQPTPNRSVSISLTSSAGVCALRLADSRSSWVAGRCGASTRPTSSIWRAKILSN